jgi:multimeric flavodoxin WrbA
MLTLLQAYTKELRELEMKALLLNGSPHKNGPTAKFLGVLIHKIKADYECQVVHAYDLKIRPCIGCLKCRPDKECVLPLDDGHLMGDRLKESDLLVIGTPSYWSNMPAPLKVIFDRNVSTLEYCLDKPPVPNMTGKKAIVAVTCASDEIRSENPAQLPLLITNIHYILRSSGYEILDTVKIHTSWDFDNRLDAISERVDQIRI